MARYKYVEGYIDEDGHLNLDDEEEFSDVEDSIQFKALDAWIEYQTPVIANQSLGGVCSFGHLSLIGDDKYQYSYTHHAACHANAMVSHHRDWHGKLVGFATSLWAARILDKLSPSVRRWFELLLDPKVSPWRSCLHDIEVHWVHECNGALFFKSMKGRESKTFFNLLVATRIPFEWPNHIRFFHHMVEGGMPEVEAFLLSFRFMFDGHQVFMKTDASWHYPIETSKWMDWIGFRNGTINNVKNAKDYCDGGFTHPNNEIWMLPDNKRTGSLLEPMSLFLNQERAETVKYSGPFQKKYQKQEEVVHMRRYITPDQAIKNLRVPREIPYV